MFNSKTIPNRTFFKGPLQMRFLHLSISEMLAETDLADIAGILTVYTTCAGPQQRPYATPFCNSRQTTFH